jgi:5-methyltetrahydropteroyltriglutamate--homocysteine methyltransferase
MKLSTERILTTHVGSLARPPDLFDMLAARASGQPYDAAAFEARVRQAIVDVVRRQAELGIDIVDDGEQGKPGFVAYISERLAGFAAQPAPQQGPTGPEAGSRELQSFPEFYAQSARRPAAATAGPPLRIVCTGPITYRGQDAAQRDIAIFKTALHSVRYEEAFLPAISVTNIESGRRNEYYRTEDEFLEAIAKAIHEEYQAIVDAGFVLQIDDPRLSTYYNTMPALSLAEWRRWAEKRVEFVNLAIGDIPPDRVRFHTCYSIDIGPRIHDMPLKDSVDIMLKVNAGAYSFEASNPRHEHEYHVWETARLPEGKAIIPGVISHTANLVEHPELIGERSVRFARAVGRERVIAGADCGFSAQARREPDIHPSVVWAKFEALAEGARLATKALWG